MSTWGERAHRAAEALDMEAIEATDPEDVWYGFREGAAWQREQLPADESVERAARVLNKAGWTCMDATHEPGRYDDCHYCRGICLALARTALTAATGDQS
ncbi:hypothetical protein M3B11_02740 [Brevibacterium sp. p3-SID960]|uniref:hypothetical protein n=1 Tax=Brevibacterium sp. p3-SID960 TaxID=2916063 RepID=UPI0021A4A669|nr:hypothetical protein [Brevibacterium sp. p3-SID960]MCT1689885.1 hypothetical protein [Brevibacterium sp. p3-SID960]